MILIGHVLDQTRQMKPKSVHMIATSPPYWSQRDYGTPPIVWGGDPACDHDWNCNGKLRRSGGTERSTLGNYATGMSEETLRKQLSHKALDTTRGETCCKCGAWRGQLGLEPTPEMYVEHIVEIFRECHRVLRDDGTLWLNIGDSYANDAKGPRGTDSSTLDNPGYQNTSHPPRMQKGYRESTLGIKRKDLVGIPWMVAFALRADGWFLRSDNIWHKPTAMPMSVRDRPSTDHEYVFLFSKKRSYYYDQVGVQVESSQASNPRGAGVNPKAKVPTGWDTGNGNHKKLTGRYERQNADFSAAVSGVVTHRNLRTVWRIASQGFKGKHYATYPPRLVENCIKAGTSEFGCCPKCAAPWKRVTRKIRVPTRPGLNTKATHKMQGDSRTAKLMGWSKPLAQGNRDPQRHVTTTETLGWYPSCRCYRLLKLPKLTRPLKKHRKKWEREAVAIHAHRAKLCQEAESLPRVPALVFDPFFGSGTTGVMAEYLGRLWTGIELSEEYAALARERLAAGYTPPKQSRRRQVKRMIDRLQKVLFR